MFKLLILISCFINYSLCCQQHPCLFYTADQRSAMWQKVNVAGSKSKYYFDTLPNSGTYGTSPWVSGRTTLFGAAAFKCALNPSSTITTPACSSSLNALQSFIAAKASPSTIPHVSATPAGQFINAMVAFDNLEPLMPNDAAHNAIRLSFISLLEGWVPKFKTYPDWPQSSTAALGNGLIPCDSTIVLALRVMEGSPYTSWSQGQIDADYNKYMGRLVNGAKHTDSDVSEGYNYDLQYNFVFLIRALKMAELRDGQWLIGDSKRLYPYTVTRDFSGRELWWIGDAIDSEKGLNGVSSTLTYLIGRLAQTDPEKAAEAMTQFWVMNAKRGSSIQSVGEIGFWLHHDFAALHYPDAVSHTYDLSAAIPSHFVHDRKNHATVVGNARYHGAALPGDGGRMTMYNTLAGNSRIGFLFQCPSGYSIHRTAFETLDIAWDVGDWRALLLPGRGEYYGAGNANNGISHHGSVRNIVIVRGDSWTNSQFNYYEPEHRCDSDHNHGVTVYSLVEGRWGSGMSASSPWMWLHDKSSVARRSVLFVSVPQTQPYVVEVTHVQKVGGMSHTYDYMLRSDARATVLSSNVLRFTKGVKKLDFTFLTSNVQLTAPATGELVYVQNTFKNVAAVTTASMTSFFVVHEPHLSGATSSSVKREGSVNGGGGGGAAVALDFGGSFVDLVVMRDYNENQIDANVGQSSATERSLATDAMLAIVRVNRVDGAVQAFSAIDGTFLTIDGFDLFRVQSASGRVSVSSGVGVQVRPSGSPMQSVGMVDASIYAPQSFMSAVPNGHSQVLYEGSAMSTQRQGDYVVFGAGGGVSGAISTTTSAPTTGAPTTAAPTTAAPTTASPTTASPTQAAQTTASPTTASPTSAAATTSSLTSTTPAPTSFSLPTVAPGSTGAASATTTPSPVASVTSVSAPSFSPFSSSSPSATASATSSTALDSPSVLSSALASTTAFTQTTQNSPIVDGASLPIWLPFAVGGCVLLLLLLLLVVVCVSLSRRRQHRRQRRTSAVQNTIGMRRTSTSSRTSSRPAGGARRSARSGVFGNANNALTRSSQHSSSRPSSRIHHPMPMPANPQVNAPPVVPGAHTSLWATPSSMSNATARPMPPPPRPQRQVLSQYDSVPDYI